MIKELQDAIDAYEKLGDSTAVTELTKISKLSDEQQREIFKTAKKVVNEK